MTSDQPRTIPGVPYRSTRFRVALLLIKASDGIEHNAQIESDGRTNEAACKLGHEGILAKGRDLPYQSGRSKRWLKIKNADSPAMQRGMDETF